MVSRYDPDAEPTIWRIPDDLGAECEPLLPPQKPLGTDGRPIVPFRKVLDGILFVLRTGTARVSQGGREIRTLGPGDFFGEIGVMHQARVAP